MSQHCAGDRPRYSTRALPPYSYVPGVNYHPVSHPQGHMHGHAPPPVSPLTTEGWEGSDEYRYGVDLFNHGFYWEAHEAWESLWHAAGRRGPIAVWLKALIKMTAAAVKLREGNARGALRHANRSRQLLAELREAERMELTHNADESEPRRSWQYCGVTVDDVDAIALAIAREAEQGSVPPLPERLLPYWLMLGDEH